MREKTIPYTVLDADGKVLRSGYCHRSLFNQQAVEPGAKVIKGIREPEQVEDVVFHGPQRKSLYPPLEEFADAMYWHSRGNPVPLQEYYEKIDLIKQKIPKNVPI